MTEVKRGRRRSRRQRRRGRRSNLKLLVTVLLIVLLATGGTLFGVWWMWGGVVDEDGVSITVSGRVGAAPVVDINGELPVQSEKTFTDTAGDGPEVGGNHPALIMSTVFDDKGALVGDGKSQISNVTFGEKSNDPALARRIEGKREGSRLILRNPVRTGDKTKMQIVIVDLLRSTAYGEPGEERTDPVSVSSREKAPEVTWKEQPANPAGASAFTVINGEGPQVDKDSELIVQYAVYPWGNNQASQSSWNSTGPTRLSLTKSLVGVRTQLPDQTVGSRVAVLVPREQSPEGKPILVVVDILAIVPGTGTNS